MKLRFLLLSHLLLILLFLFSSPSFASSPGLNLINQSGSADPVPNIGNVKNWMLYTPNHPTDLRFSPPSAPNIVLRIHSAWTSIGQQMLGDPAQQNQTAQSWCQSINAFAPTKSKVYVEPFNELSHPSERRSPSGTLDLDTAIALADAFISKLQTCLDSGITITSPALDPQNADFPKTSQAFSYFSVISYHPYREDTARNYSSGPLAGKQFIFTETGTIKNGRVVYNDCDLIDFYCGQDITPFWQTQSDIIAHFLFTFSPGDYSGSWQLRNPNVVKALTAQCGGDLTCQPTDCNLETMEFPAVNINEAKQAEIPPPADHPQNKHKDYYPLRQEYVTVCDYEVGIEQKYDERKDPATDETLEYDVREVKEAVEKNEVTSRYAKSNAKFLKTISNPFVDKKEIMDGPFKSYGDDNISFAYRATPSKLQKEFKNELLKQVINGTATNEQIAWECTSGCFTLNCGKPDDSCQPVHLMNIALQNTSCYNQIYRYLNFSKSGSLNSKVVIHNSNQDPPEELDRMIPNGAVLTESIMFQQTIPKNQKKSSDKICKTVKRSPTEDTTNLLKFNFFKLLSNVVRIITGKVVTAEIFIEEQYDPRLKPAILTQKTFYEQLIPKKTLKLIGDKADSGTTGKVNLRDQGGGDLETKQNTFADYLHPASWQTGQDL